MNKAKPCTVFNNQHKCIECRFAEILAGQSDLNIGVLSDELNAFFKAPEAIWCVAEKTLDNWIVLWGFLDILSIVLEDDSNELDYSYNATSKGDWSQMVSEDPLDTCEERAFTWGVTSEREVPNSACWGYDKLATTNDEGIYP